MHVNILNARKLDWQGLNKCYYSFLCRVQGDGVSHYPDSNVP